MLLIVTVFMALERLDAPCPVFLLMTRGFAPVSASNLPLLLC